MTINLTFNSYEEMQEFCGAVAAKAEIKGVEEPAKKKPAKKTEEAKTPTKEDGKEEPPWEKAVSVEEVRKAAGEYIKSHGKDALLGILKEWNAKNISSLAEEHYAAFMKKVGE